jgi:hypothetical protein
MFVQEVRVGTEQHIRIYCVRQFGDDAPGNSIHSNEVQQIKCLPSSRGIAARLNWVWLVNICAPSGAERRREGEEFYTVELPYFMRTIPDRVIL